MDNFISVIKMAALMFICLPLGLVQERFALYAEEKPSWQVEWRKTVEAAKRKGK